MDVMSDVPPKKTCAWMMASLRTLDIALHFETTLACEPLPLGDTLVMARLPDYHCRPEQFFPRKHINGAVGFVASSSGVPVMILAERMCPRVLDRDLLWMQSEGAARVSVTAHDPARNTVLCAVEFNVKALHGMLHAVILGQPDALAPLILNWVRENCAQKMAAHLINSGALNTRKMHHGALNLHIPVLMQQQQQQQHVSSTRAVEALIIGSVRTPLYTYQVEALEWMLEVEARCLHGVAASSETPFMKLCEHAERVEDMWQPVTESVDEDGGDKKKVWCDAIDCKRLCFGQVGHAPPGYDLYSRGGVLADEVGIGKTLEVLALIAASAATAATPPPGITMHAGVPRLRSSATLIVCPSHLVAHWLAEMHKHVCAAWTVVKLVNRADVAAVTWSDILNAKVVIASREMLIGASYAKASLPGLTSRRAICRRRSALDASARAATALGFPDTPGVTLEAVRWRRLVVDEAHEGMQTYIYGVKKTMHQSRLSAMLAALASDTRWYVSGTPISSVASLASIQDFLQTTVRRVNWETPDPLFDSDALVHADAIHLAAVSTARDEPLFNAMFTRSLILRRTRESVEQSVAQEAAVPPAVQYVEWLDLTPTERALYEAREASASWNTMFLRRTCCSPSIDSGGGGSAIMPLAEVRELLLCEQQKLLSIKEDALGVCKKNLAGLQQVHLTLRAAGHATLIQPAIEALGLELAMSACEDAQKEMDDIHRIMAFVRHAATEVSTSQACPVCLDDAHAKRAITRCGHSFCPPCILRAIETTHTCPNCRARLDARKDVFILAAPPPSAPTGQAEEDGGDDAAAAAQEAQETQQWLEKYGAKSARLLRLTKTSGGSSFIIFSEFDDELARTGEVLNREGVHAAWCRGSVSCRSAAVAKFQAGVVKVLLLSARHCASGTDLSCADHVILLGPLDGSSAEVSSMEAQALGRARRMGQHKTVKFIHFVARGTVEEVIYHRHHVPFF